MTLDTGLTQLLSTLIGGAAAICGGIGAQWFAARHGRRNERRALAGAFAGEIAALLALTAERRYEQMLDALIAEVERTGALPRFVFSLRHHYFRVFDANAARLGVLHAPLPEMLVRYYVTSKVFLEDMQDAAGELRELDRDRILERLRVTRAMVAGGIGLVPLCHKHRVRHPRERISLTLGPSPGGRGKRSPSPSGRGVGVRERGDGISDIRDTVGLGAQCLEEARRQAA